MYRYVRRTPLATGQKYGDILRDGDLKPAVIKKFLASGTLVKVGTPPLTQIPAFEKRAGNLAQADVKTLEDLVESDPAKVAKKTGKSSTTVRRWQSEAMKWVEPPEEDDLDIKP